MASTTTPTGAPSRPAAPSPGSQAATPAVTGTAGSGENGAGKKSGSGKKSKGGAGLTKRGGGLTKRGKVAVATAAAAGVAAATAAGVAAVKAIRRKRADARVYHVEPKGEDWQVRKEGAERPSGVHGTKKEAIASGRALAQKHEPSRLIIHGGDGSVQRDHSYGEQDD